MRFHAEHRFSTTVPAVVELLADPEFYVELTLPDLNQPEVLEHHSDGDKTTIRLRYQFIGSLDPLARRLLGANRLTWIQELIVNRSAASGTLSYRAESDPKRLHGSASFALFPDGHGTIRRLDGELVVAVPVVGPVAERRIVPGLLRRLDIEAQALEERTGSRG